MSLFGNKKKKGKKLFTDSDSLVMMMAEEGRVDTHVLKNQERIEYKIDALGAAFDAFLTEWNAANVVNPVAAADFYGAKSADVDKDVAEGVYTPGGA